MERRNFIKTLLTLIIGFSFVRKFLTLQSKESPIKKSNPSNGMLAHSFEKQFYS